MAESQSDRLKRELRFLKESFEAGIISEEEFSKGKKRIEGKLAEWGEGVVEEYKEENNEKAETQEKLDEYEEKENDAQDIIEKKQKKQKTEKKPTEIPEEDEFEDEDKGIGIGKMLLFAIAIIAAIFLIRACVGNPGYTIDKDLIILTDARCDNCDTTGAENVIDKLFPGLTKRYVDYSTKEGKAMYKDLGIQLLPAYIFKDSIETTGTWNTNPNIKNSFQQKKEYWILKPDQTNSEWKP